MLSYANSFGTSEATEKQREVVPRLCENTRRLENLMPPGSYPLDPSSP